MLRGEFFGPVPELNQHLNLVNEKRGNKSPPGTIIPKWNSQYPPAGLDKDNKKTVTNRDRMRKIGNQQQDT